MRPHPAPVFLFLAAVPAAALAGSPLVITEISTVGAAEHEWVEVRNVGDAPVDLTAWRFWEQRTNHGIKASQGGETLPPGAFAIVAEDAATFLADRASSTLLVFDSSWGSLAEAGEEIGLRDASGSLVEGFTYPDTGGAVIERVDPILEPTAENWCASPDGDSAGMENRCTEAATEGPAETGGRLTLSEIFPAPPAGEKEWIELWNGGGAAVPGGACSLADANGRIADVAEEVAPDAFAVVTLTSAKLNNDGDAVILSCGGTETDRAAYDAGTAPASGQSLARETLPDGAWRLTTEPTLGAANRIAEPPTAPASRRSAQEAPERRFPPGRVLVNEIFPGDRGMAWIEIANPEPRAVALAGWMLRVDTEQPIPLTGTLGADGHLLLRGLPGAVDGRRGIALLIDPEGYTAEQVLWGDGDATPENNAPGAARAGTSVARLFDAFSTGNPREDFAVTVTPTPGEANQVTPPLAGGSPLRFSEALPDPAGPDEPGEFVELENVATSAVRLIGWKIAVGRRRPSPLPSQEIASGAFAAFGREDVRVALPNAGGEIALIAPDGTVADRFTYEAAETGIAVARDADGAWSATSVPTRGAANVTVAPAHPPHAAFDIARPDAPGEPFAFDASESWDTDGRIASYRWDFGDGGTAAGSVATHVYASSGKFSVALSVADAGGASSTLVRSLRVYKKDLPEEEEDAGTTVAKGAAKATAKTKKTTVKKRAAVSVEGVALAERGPLGAQTVPILTPAGGMLIELPKGSREIARGDRVSARGTVVVRSGQERIRVQTLAAEAGASPGPTTLTALEDAEDAGILTLVAATGTVIDRTAQKITLSRDGELAVKLPAGLKDRDAYAVGAEIRAVGVLRLTAKGERELVARDAADLAVLSPAPLPAAEPKPEPPISPASAGATGAASGVLLAAGWTASGGWRRRLASLFTRTQTS